MTLHCRILPFFIGSIWNTKTGVFWQIPWENVLSMPQRLKYYVHAYRLGTRLVPQWMNQYNLIKNTYLIYQQQLLFCLNSRYYVATCRWLHFSFFIFCLLFNLEKKAIHLHLSLHITLGMNKKKVLHKKWQQHQGYKSCLFIRWRFKNGFILCIGSGTRLIFFMPNLFWFQRWRCPS